MTELERATLDEARVLLERHWRPGEVEQPWERFFSEARGRNPEPWELEKALDIFDGYVEWFEDEPRLCTLELRRYGMEPTSSRSDAETVGAMLVLMILIDHRKAEVQP